MALKSDYFFVGMSFESFLIIVPTLDSYDLLPRLRDSLLQQSFTSWRVLFVNGASSAKHNSWLKECCSLDQRFSYFNEESDRRGIYAAMNHGIRYAMQHELILFWGSDDWAANQYVLESLAFKVNYSEHFSSADLFVCSARYFDPDYLASGRVSRFSHKSAVLCSHEFRSRLFWGATPPHQGTIFTFKLLTKAGLFDESLKLASDLEFFLRVSSFPHLKVAVFDSEVVNMLSSGISSKMHNLRLREVCFLYAKYFNILFFLPFISRYIRRYLSTSMFMLPLFHE